MRTLATPPELLLVYADASPTEIEQANSFWGLLGICNGIAAQQTQRVSRTGAVSIDKWPVVVPEVQSKLAAAFQSAPFAPRMMLRGGRFSTPPDRSN